jgi:rhodanese-related sulfurtransferase
MTLKTITPLEAKAWLDRNEAVLLDVREAAEYKATHILGSHWIPLGQISAARLPRGHHKKILIHCQAGKRGEKACTTLMAEQSDLDVYNIEGGLNAWAAAGLPMQTGTVLPLNRQVQVAVGLLLVLFTVAGFGVHPVFHILAGLMGLGLINAGVTGWCGMATVLAKMPWNRGS